MNFGKEDITMKLTWTDFFKFYIERLETPTPITDSYMMDPEFDYQQRNCGYIRVARKYGIIKDRTRIERNKISQKWHFIVSFLWKDKNIDLNYIRLITQEEQVEKAIVEIKNNPEAIRDKGVCFLPCPELALWMAEIAGVFQHERFLINEKLLEKMLKAIKEKKILGLPASKVWREVNTEVFKQKYFIWTSICDAVKANEK